MYRVYKWLLLALSLYLAYCYGVGKALIALSSYPKRVQDLFKKWQDDPNIEFYYSNFGESGLVAKVTFVKGEAVALKAAKMTNVDYQKVADKIYLFT